MNHHDKLPTSLALAALLTACGHPTSTEPRTPSGPATSAAAQVAPVEGPTSTRALARRDGSRQDDHLAEGDAAYASEDFARALAAYQRAAVLAPDDPAGHVGVFRATLASKGFPEGVGAGRGDATGIAVAAGLRDLVAKHPGYAPAQLELGRVLLVVGELAAARAPAELAAKLLPRDPEALSVHGIALLVSGERDAAVEALRRAASLEPGSASRHANLATTELQAGLLADAIVSYRTAARLAPSDPGVRTSLGTALLQAGDLGAALPELEEAARLGPEVASVRNNLGFGYQATGDFERAAAEYRRAIELDPEFASPHINLAVMAAKQRDFAGARASLARAATISPDDPRVREVTREVDELAGARP